MSLITRLCGSAFAIADQNICSDQITDIPFAVIGNYGVIPTSADPEYLTAAEMQTYLTAGNGLVLQLAGASIPAMTFNEETDTATHQGKSEKYNFSQNFTGNIKDLNDKIKKALRINNINNPKVRVWYVAETKNGNFVLYGGVGGFICKSAFFPDPQFDAGGLGEYIAMDLKLEKPQKIFYHVSPADDYETLDNVENVGIYTVTPGGDITYSIIALESYMNITGWNKETYPILYAKVNAGGDAIDLFGSAAERTAGTPILGSIDNEGVVTGTTLGGQVVIDLAEAFVIADTYEINYAGF